MGDEQRYDLIIIGAGIGGVVCLHYARKAGLNVLLLEKQACVGGLWAGLPAWQDIQINKNDWTLGELPIGGTDQASILANIRAWVDSFDLASSIRLNTPVIQAQANATGWTVTTPARSYQCEFLVAATGAHNRPLIPQIERAHASVREFHSSALHDPQALGGRDVLVVGGGASAYDLLDLCFDHAARRVTWVYRTLKWMVPTRKPKRIAGDLRGLSKQQMLGVSVEQMNVEFNRDLRSRYEKFGLLDILPQGDFDLSRDQMIPGRRAMIENFSRIDRHRGTIARIDGNTVHLSTGTRIDADLVLWGTGYAIDQSYFEAPALAGATNIAALAARCGSLFRSLDAPKLFLLAPALLETTSTSPWAYAHASRTIVSHIRGQATLGVLPVLPKLNYFELPMFLAAHDAENYPPATWFSDYRELALNHPDDAPLPIP